MSVLGEAHLSDLRAGFGGYGFSSGLGFGQSPMLPLWRPTPTPALSWCTSATCPCTLNRPYLMAEYFDYTSSFARTWPPSWYLKSAQDPLYKGPPPPPPPPPALDRRESPCKELPTKAMKLERAKDRLELSQPLHFDKDHASKHSRKCTGTQTQISSVSPDPYRNGETSTDPPAYSLHHQSLLSYTTLVTSQQHQQSIQTSSARFAHLDLHEAPLNLSLTNSASGGCSPSQSRPSVITCASSSSSNGRYENNVNGSHSPSRREVASADACDPDIEEHFRRSLGKNYPDYLAKQQPPSPSPSPPPPPQVVPPLPPLPPPPVMPAQPNVTAVVMKKPHNVSVTGCVDDHFAKSLGDSTWSKLKAKNDPSDPTPGSVDDHFAKALGGDTWLRIKAEKEGGRPSHPYPLAHPMSNPHAHPHSIAHPPLPHGLSHPIPHTQRSSSPPSQHSTSLLST